MLDQILDVSSAGASSWFGRAAELWRKRGGRFRPHLPGEETFHHTESGQKQKKRRGKCFTIMANTAFSDPSLLFFLPILFSIYSTLLLLTLSVHHSRLLSSLLIIFALSQHLWTASPKQICCGSVVSVNLCPSGFQLIKLFKVVVNLKSNCPQCYLF